MKNNNGLASLLLSSVIAATLAMTTLAADDPTFSECQTVYDAVLNKLCTDLAPCTISFECESSGGTCSDACFGSGGAMHEDCGKPFIGDPGQYSMCYPSAVGGDRKCGFLYGCGAKGEGTCGPLAGYPGEFECSPDIITVGYCARTYCEAQVFTP